MSHLQIPGVLDCIDEVTPTCVEAKVTALWQNLLHYIFPLQEYKIEQELLLDDKSRPDLIVVKVVWTGTVPRGDVLMVECKRPDKDTPAEWQSAAAQLEHYLNSTRNANDCLYGAVAIGLKVKFFKFADGNMVEISGMLSVDKMPGAAAIEQHLQRMKVEVAAI